MRSDAAIEHLYQRSEAILVVAVSLDGRAIDGLTDLRAACRVRETPGLEEPGTIRMPLQIQELPSLVTNPRASGTGFGDTTIVPE